MTPVGPVCVDGSTTAPTFEVVALSPPDTVDLANLTVIVTYAATVEMVYTAAAFVAPYDTSAAPVHTSTPLEDVQTFVLTRTGGWPASTVFDIAVFGVTTGLAPYYAEWSFCTLAAPPIPPAPVSPHVYPDDDTIRGGSEVVFYLTPAGVDLLDASRDESFLSLTLPAPALPTFLTATSGSGEVRPTTDGLQLRTGPIPTSDALVYTDPADLEHFDVAVDVDLLGYPRDFASSAPAVLAELSFGFVPTGGTYAGAQLVLPRGSSLPSALGIFSDHRPGAVVPLTQAQAASRLTLRVVRHADRVWAFVGTRRPTELLYTSLTPLLARSNFPTGPGLLRLRVAHAGPEGVITRFRRFTVQSHATIDDVLVDSIAVVSATRIVANVPATVLERRGTRDIAVFGLFGEALGPDLFTYTLPDPRTVGTFGRQQVAAPYTMRSYLDASLRDVSGPWTRKS